MTVTDVDPDGPAEVRGPAVPVPAYPVPDARLRTPKQADGPPVVGLGAGRRPVPAVRAAVLPLADAVALGVAAVATAGIGWFAGLYALIVLAALAADGQHRPRICARVSDQAPRTVAVAALPLLLVPVLPGPEAAGAELRLAAYAAGLLVLCRAGACVALRAAHRHGFAVEPTLIVGTGAVAVRIAELLREHPELGLRPVGFADSQAPRPSLGLPLLGPSAELAALVARHGIERVIVCFPAASDSDLVPVLRACQPLAADVCVVPRCYELGAAVPRACLDEVWGIPLMPLRRWPHTRAAALGKRCFDLAIAGPLLLVLVPVLALLGAAIRFGAGHSPLFRQVRVTRGGALRAVVKLRTVDDRRHRDTSWAVPADHCTRLGRWLRATHLDELPQLVNVLRGEMSLVGPRPERPYFAARFAREIPRYDDRHRVLGGMTGWAQVHGLHGDTSIPDRVRFDNQYIEYWSPWLDLVILARTVTTVLRGISPAPLPVRARPARRPVSVNHVSIQGGRP